jgi:hypothetical protein
MAGDRGWRWVELRGVLVGVAIWLRFKHGHGRHGKNEFGELGNLN